ncbi:MAG: acetyl-CoA hydrolase/transferase family protein [Candidatus Zixiibacteriota bacterium]|nr:MAG: acetyl-CoA hydrolase/transferase family protein [candidate division Zixibacteria bacterium]
MNWIDLYERKKAGGEEALKIVKSGDRVYIHAGCAEPEHLVKHLTARKDSLENVEIVHLLTVGTADYVNPEMEGHFRHRSLFTGTNVRKAVNEGRADQTHIFLSEIEDLFTSGQLPVDAALIHCSPPDEHGFLSYGVGVEITKAAAECARCVIAQVNPEMPRILGDNFIHLRKITHVVEHSAPILELPQGQPDDISRAIGGHIAGLIEDGSTLQMGIGAIPDGVLFNIGNKNDLGIHTEMFSDGVIDLVEAGVVNNEKKTLHPGKIVASFMLGTRRCFDFADDNPIIELHPSKYVNNPFIIAQNDRMVAINSALSIDLTGQANSDSLGTYFYSGIGGQVDFIRGAARSKGGKPIIALPSTAKSGTISRIAAVLPEGTGITTSRGDIHWVVTEYGAVNLHGRSVGERAKLLISIAHPDFKSELDNYARGKKWFV